MRRLHRAFGLGDPSSCGAPPDYTDDSVIDSTTSCMESAAASTTFAAKMSAAWRAAEVGAASGASAGLAAGLAVDAGVAGLEDIIDQFGFDIVAEWIETEFVALCTTAADAASLVVSTTASGSALGPVGAVVGFIVGAVIAIVEVLSTSCTVEITNGANVSCANYTSNLNSAISMLNTLATTPGGTVQQNGQTLSLIGMTPLWVANTFELFLANPVWLWLNQQFTGIVQGQAPPGWGSGAPLVLQNTDPNTQIYFLLPGAFEILNRVQLAAAAALVAAAPSKLPFYLAVVPGGSETSWTVWGSELPATPPPPYQAIPARSWTPGDVSTDSSNNSWAVYGPCPNLSSNGNGPTQVGGQVGGSLLPPGPQTNPGGFMLQFLYPSLTTAQCYKIFNANLAAYEAVVTAAKAWVNTQCYPTAADLGSGSQFNLEPPDVAAVLASWSPSNLQTALCDQTSAPSGWTSPAGSSASAAVTAASTSVAASPVVRGAAVIGGLGLVGVALFAARGGVSVPVAARSIYRSARSLKFKL